MTQAQPLSRDAFEARLRQIGAERYHDLHPFHHRLHGGGCTPNEVRAWVINRYYYQHSIPMKDAAFMSRRHRRKRGRHPALAASGRGGGS
jgi:pyrroloquinoline-quinone synthase